mgnify:CR=1 FL=1
MIVSKVFEGKSYAVLGLARSGVAAVEALAASGAEILAWDNREDARAAVADKAEIADPLAADLSGYDGVVVSPGVPLNRHPIADKARESNVPIIGRTRVPNLYLNTGHGTLGWTMACGSGKALADIISGRTPAVQFPFT